MKIGIFTYGSRGDVQPFIALAIALKARGHDVLLGAPENFQTTVESYNISYHKIHGDLEKLMYEPGIQTVLNTGNSFTLLRALQKNADEDSQQVSRDLIAGCEKVDGIITTFIPLFYVASIAEKLRKPLINVIFNPPTTATKEFPNFDLDFLNFPTYNCFSHNLFNFIIWQVYKKRINQFRQEIGLAKSQKSILKNMEETGVPTIYAISPQLVAKPTDWKNNYSITGFLSLKETINQENKVFADWLKNGLKPIYIGFGSIPMPKKMIDIIQKILQNTNERIVLCKGWSVTDELQNSERLFIVDSASHDWLFPQCKLAIFHGGAGTLSNVLKSQIPVIIISIFADQPTWGKIVAQKKLGIYIPAKKITAEKIILTIQQAQTDEIKSNVGAIGQKIRNENGVENATNEIEKYFNKK